MCASALNQFIDERHDLALQRCDLLGEARPRSASLHRDAVGADASEVAGNSYTFNLITGTTFTDTQAFAVFAADTTINGNGDTLQASQPPSNEKGVLTTTSPLSVNNLSIIGTPGIGMVGVPGSGSGISAIDGGNSSAIREQANGANTLNLTGVTISGFQMGVLTGSDSGKTISIR